MPTLTSISSADNFSPAPPPGGGPTAPGGISTGTGGGGFPGFSNVHNLADRFTQGPQAVLNQKLAQISQLAKTDKAAAQSALVDAWGQFLSDAQAFSNSSVFGQRIVEQALSTPALTQTVDALWNETGGSATGLNSITSTGSIGGKVGGLIISSIPFMIEALRNLGRPKVGTTGGTTGTNGTTNGTGTTTKPDPTTESPGKAPEGVNQSWWDKYGGLVLTAGGVAGNLWGAAQASGSAKEAAAIYAESANKATKLQEDIYRQNRQDMAPWLNTGRTALHRLSDLVGLSPTDRSVQPDIFKQAAPTPPAPATTAAPVAPPPTQPPNPNVDQNVPQGVDERALAQSQTAQPLNFDAISAMYRQGRRPAGPLQRMVN